MADVDYAALAKQAGGLSSTPAPSAGIDYEALAKQAGALRDDVQMQAEEPAAPPNQEPAKRPAPPAYAVRGFTAVGPPTPGTVRQYQTPGYAPSVNPPPVQPTWQDAPSHLKDAAMTPLLDVQGIDKDLQNVLVGPFMFHRKVVDAAAGMTSPLNLGIGAVAGPVIDAIGEMGAAGPAIAKTISLGLAGYFGKPAADHAATVTPKLVKAIKEGDTEGAFGAAGELATDLTIAGTALWHGTKTAAEMVIPESRESYYQRQYAKPPYQRDPGVDWRSGQATPENGAPAPPQKLLGSGSPGEPPPPPPAPPDYGLMPDEQVVEHLKAAQASGDQGALGNILGEVHRRMAARQQTPAQSAQPSDTVLTPEQADLHTTINARQIADAVTRQELPAAPEQAPRVLVTPRPQGPSGEAIPMPGQLQRALPAPVAQNTPQVPATFSPEIGNPAGVSAEPTETPAVAPETPPQGPIVKSEPLPPPPVKAKGRGKPAGAFGTTQERIDRRAEEARQLMIDAGVDPDEAAVPAPPPGFQLVKEKPDATTLEQPAATAVEESQSSTEEGGPPASASQGKRPAGSAAERGPAAGPAVSAGNDAAGPGLLTEPPEGKAEVLNYKRGSDTATAIIRHDPEKGYSAEADHDFSGFSGGHLGDSGYQKYYPTREAALDAMAKNVDITRKLGLGNGGGPKTLPTRVAKMQAWFDGLAAKDDATPAAATREPWQMTSDEFIDSKGIKAGKAKIQQAHDEHSRLVYAAVDAGKPVPPEVLKEYPGAAVKTANPDSPLEKSVAANRKRSAEIKAQFDNATYGNGKLKRADQMQPGDRYFDTKYGYVTVEDVLPVDPAYPTIRQVETNRGRRQFHVDHLETVESPTGQAKPAEPDMPEPEVLSYTGKGKGIAAKDSVTVTVEHHPRGWVVRGEYNLEGQEGGGTWADSGYDRDKDDNIYHPTRAAAIRAFQAEALNQSNGGPRATADLNYGVAQPVRRRAQDMVTWITKLSKAQAEKTNIPAPAAATAPRTDEALKWAKSERMDGRRTNIPQLMQNFGLTREDATRIFDQSIDETSGKAPVSTGVSENLPEKAEAAPVTTDDLWKQIKAKVELSKQAKYGSPEHKAIKKEILALRAQLPEAIRREKGGFSGVIRDETPAPAPEKGAVSPAPRKPAKITPAIERRRDYFTPGNVVTSYFGQDKVLAYDEQPDGTWTATVRAVLPDGSPDPNDDRTRIHSTEPGKDSKVLSREAPQPTPVAPTVSAETPAAAEPESTIRVTPHKPNVNEGDGFKVTHTKGGQAVYLRPYWATGKFHVEEHGPTENVSNWPHPGTHEVSHTNKLTEPLEKDKALAYAKAYLQDGREAAEATLPAAQPQTPAPVPAPTPEPAKPLGKPSVERFNAISRELNELPKNDALTSAQKHNRRIDLEKELEHHRPAAEAAAQAEIDQQKGKEEPVQPAAPLPANVEQEFAARHKDNLAAARKRGYVDADPEKVKATLLTLTQQLNGGDSASASVGDRDVAIHRKKEWEGRGKKRTQVVSYTAFLTKPGKQTINYTARDPEAAVYWATEALHSLGVRPDFWDDYRYGGRNNAVERLVKTGDMLPNTESAMAASDAAAKAIGQPKLSGDIYSQAFGGGWKPGHAGMTFADIAKAYAENLPRNEEPLLERRRGAGVTDDPNWKLLQEREPSKGYQTWESQVEDYERNAKGIAENLKNIRRKIETAKLLNGGTTPRIAESEKVFNDLEANIKKNLAFVKEQAKVETAKELVDVREKVRPLAEAYAKYGEAAFGAASSVASDPDSHMRRYARLKGLAVDPLKQGGGEHQGQSGWAAVMKDLGIAPQKPPKRVEVPTTGKDRLTKAELAAIEKVQLGQDQIVPGDTGVMAKLAARGWLTDDYKLTPAGEAAVYSLRMDAVEAAAGKPISEYTPKKQATIPGMGESRYGNEATAWNTVDGDVWHTEGHGAWKGEFPKNWAPRDVKKTGPNIAQVIEPGKHPGSLVPIKPVGFYTYTHKDGNSQNIVFDNGAAMSAVNYDYTLHRNGGEVSWRQSDPKSAFFGYDKDGEIVAAVMPMKIEDVPAKLQQYLDPATVEAQKRTKDRAELKRLKKSLAERAEYEKPFTPDEQMDPHARLPVGMTKEEVQARVAELEAKLGKGPQLSSRGPEESGPPKTVAELLPDATANRLRRRGAQLVDTLRVNQEAADVLGHAYELGGGERMGAFDGAALTPEHAKTTLEGLRPLFSQDSDLPSNAKLAAARIYGQLKKASGNGSRGVAIAMPGAESHEQLHFAVNQFKFDPDKVLEHGPTRVAVLEARSRGFVKSSDSDARVIREVMTRIWANEHGTLKINNETAVKIAADFLENATPETGALDTLEGLAHESHQTTIRDANQRRVDDGTESVRGEESGPSTRYRQEAGSPGGDRGTAPHPETGEGPELAKRVGFSDDEEGSAPADLLGLGKFVDDDVTPTLTKAATGIAEALDDGLKILAPTLRDEASQRAGLSLRHRAAELARGGDQAQAATAEGHKIFEKQPREENYGFINRVEAGKPQADPNLEPISKTLSELLDGRRKEVQALGTGKLRKFYEHYFPHIWDNPKRAAQVFASLFGRRPIEGGKAFLKQRTHITFQDGLDAGLTPVSDNPVDLALLKIREMDRYIMAHRLLNEWKGSKLARFVDARNTEQQQGMKRAGWRQITDPIGTVYGPSVQQITEFPNEGLWNGLQAVAEALNLKQERGFLNLHGAVGRAQQGTGRVQTLHGTAEDVLAHEIGHQIDWLAGSGKRFVTEYPDPETVATLKAAYATMRDKGAAPSSRTAARKTIKGLHDAIQDRKEFARQLRALADLRGGDRSYTHKREEKMALLAEMWVGSRESFKRTAPRVFKLWKQFLNENPKLHALRDIEGNTEVLPLAQPYDVGGLVIKGHWWAPDGAARILDNYLSPGLRSKSGAYRALLGTNNVLNQAQLGVSAFHLGFTSADAAVSKGALAIEQALRGQPVAAVKSAAGVPISPVSTWLMGRRVLAEWNKAGSQSPEIAAIVDALVKGGGRAHMDEMYQTHIGEKMLRAFRNGNLLGGLLRAPFAGMEALSDITMRHIVPAQKLGVFADLARHEMERLGPAATEEQVRDAMAKCWDSVENRMGQMTYDNLFWDRTAKDLAMLCVRSVGWNLGTLREIGGAGVDTLKIPIQAATGKKTFAQANLHRLAYVASLAITGAVMGAIYQYLATGKGPEELKDYYFPKTGQLDEAGRPQRASMPTYVKDVYHYATEPGKTLANKVSPLATLIAEMVRNQDFYGTKIRNEDDPLIQQMLDSAKHVAASAEPFGFRNLERETKLQAPTAQRVQQFVGITPAPAALERTKAEQLASELAGSNIPAGSRTKEEAERRTEEHTIRRLAQLGRPTGDEIGKALREGTITVPEARRAIHDSHIDPLARSFKGLGLAEGLKVWAAATADERRRLRPLLLVKGKSLKEKPAAERAVLLPKLVAALRQ